MKLVYNNDYIDLVTRSENDLLSSLNGLSKERFYFKPSKNSWSIYESLIHILIIEKNISKIINIESHSYIRLKQNVGMEKIIEFMEHPENYIAPDFSLPNEENIKKLFEEGSSISIHGLEKISGGISDINDEQVSEAEMISEKKRSSGKTYDVIFGSKGSRLLKEEKNYFKEKKKIYAAKTNELYYNKEGNEKNLKNPFYEKYVQNDGTVEIRSVKEDNTPIKLQQISKNTPSSDIFSSQKNIKELMNLFIGIRDELINFFLKNPEEDLNTFYFAHPTLGYLTKEEWLFYLVSHTNRHRKQIENIKVRLPFTI